MKQLFVFIISSFIFPCILSSQIDSRISIGAVCQTEMKNLNGANLSKLQNILERVLTTHGVSSSMYGDFVAYPVFGINDTKVVEGGMRKITVLEADLTLYITQLSSGNLIHSLNLPLKGSGFGMNEAVANAFSKINPRDLQFAEFINNAKERIFKYYEDNCAAMISRAKNLAQQKDFEQALALLATFPETLPSYKNVDQAVKAIYMQYQNYVCEKQINEAKALIATREFDKAADVLTRIDTESRCKVESANLIQTLGKQLSKERADEIANYYKELEMQVNLEKERINAVKEIAKAYYSNQPQINYTQVVRY